MLQRPDVHSRPTFVAPAVATTPLTERIIQGIMPFFPRGCRVISGFLDASDQLWKVNYHWEYLLWMIGKAQGIAPTDACRRDLQAIAARLRSNPPMPATGYFRPGHRTMIGVPRDVSTLARVNQRWRLLRDGKRQFRAVSVRHRIWLKRAGAPPVCWHYAAAPVAPPGRSKHGTGYAVDISGNGATIKSICKGLGASLVFDEKSHVHVEFARGVNAPQGSDTAMLDYIVPDWREKMNASIDAFFAQNPGLLDDLEATEAEASTEEFLAEADQISFHAMS